MMQTLHITIKDPKMEEHLRALAEKGLIEISGEEAPPSLPNNRRAGWGLDIIAGVKPSFDDPLDEFKEYE